MSGDLSVSGILRYVTGCLLPISRLHSRTMFSMDI